MAESLATTVLAEGRYFCEGPRWHDGRFWFSDFYAHQVCSVGLDGDGEVEVELGDEQPSGLGWLPDGRLLVVAMLGRRLLRREADGSLVTHAELGEIATFHCNDMLVDADGNAYVGNFGFDLDAYLGTHGVEGLFAGLAEDPSRFMASVALVSADGAVSVAASQMLFPNGTALVDGGATLVIAQTLGMELTAFSRAADGTLHDRRTWASTVGADGAVRAPDGIAADARGGIWVADALSPTVVRIEEGGDVTHLVTSTQNCFACAVGGPSGTHLLACTAPESDAEGAAATPRARLEIVELAS